MLSCVQGIAKCGVANYNRYSHIMWCLDVYTTYIFSRKLTTHLKIRPSWQMGSSTVYVIRIRKQPKKIMSEKLRLNWLNCGGKYYSFKDNSKIKKKPYSLYKSKWLNWLMTIIMRILHPLQRFHRIIKCATLLHKLKG